MKKYLLICLMFFTLKSIAQEQTIYLSKEKINPFDCQFARVIKDKNDTAYYVYMGFRNAKYTAIADFKDLLFTDLDDLQNFSDDMDSANRYIDDKSIEMSWAKKNYKIYKFEGRKYLSIYDGRDLGYTTVSSSQANKLMTWVREVLSSWQTF